MIGVVLETRGDPLMAEQQHRVLGDSWYARSVGGLELLDAENLRPHYARTLWAWSDGLEARLDEARALTSAAAVRAYRLYLAGSALCFERGWLSLYQLLAARPDGRAERGRAWCALSDYPFTRRHLLS